jgi:ATP-binding cassette subfamily C protein CydC
VRRRLAVVAQDTHLFNATLRDNLLLARPEASADEIEAAVRAAQLDGYVGSLQKGYDTWIGEQGLRLSGGERQRLAIARALLKDAPILIMDEPTSGLDSFTERKLWESVRRFAEGRTMLLITHRLALARDADRVIVMRDGRVSQEGTHADLITRPGLYRTLWESQCQELP